MLEYTYGFRCTCQACTITRESFSSTVHPPPTQSLTASYSLLRDLRHLVFGTAEPRNTTLDLPTPADADPTELLARLASSPTPLKAILHESFLPFLSEEFSKLCHEPRRGEAPFDGGEALLALYLIVYPRFYPQIGSSGSFNPIISFHVLISFMFPSSSYLMFPSNFISCSCFHPIFHPHSHPIPRSYPWTLLGRKQFSYLSPTRRNASPRNGKSNMEPSHDHDDPNGIRRLSDP